MKCPNCGIAIFFEFGQQSFTQNAYMSSRAVNIKVGFCPECKKPIVYMDEGTIVGYDSEGDEEIEVEKSQRLYPVWEQATLLDDSIPQKYADKFLESERVNNISPMASATLSRYLLQMILHEELHISKRNLAEELDELEKRPNIPSELVMMLQVMRKVANFGAHPKKSTNSNEIVEVEDGEAAVMLELLNQLFDYVFVKPKQQEKFLKDIEEKYGIKP